MIVSTGEYKLVTDNEAARISIRRGSTFKMPGLLMRPSLWVELQCRAAGFRGRGTSLDGEQPGCKLYRGYVGRRRGPVTNRGLGGVAERLNAAVLKTVILSDRGRGFESLLLR